MAIPDLVSQTEKSATDTLEGLNLKVKKTQEFSDEQPSGAVIETKPAAGTEVEKGSEVELVISKGVEKVKVPEVVNKTVEEAQAELEAAGLKASLQTKPSARKQGVVFETDPRRASGSTRAARCGSTSPPRPRRCPPSSATTSRRPRACLRSWASGSGSSSSRAPSPRAPCSTRLRPPDRSSSRTPRSG
nr:hypothetical protein GCM10020093_076710 [Planobispora longispora]